MSQEMEIVVHDIARGGSGVSKDTEGRILFVPFTAPGDKARVSIQNIHKNYAQAELVSLLEPSSIRVTPKCPVFSQCGGCQWQHIPYSLQWETKFKGVRHALERVGLMGISLESFPAKNPWGYRNRVQLRGEKETLGFYASGSHTVIPIERCPIAREEINAALPSLRAQGKSKTRPYKIEVEVFPDGVVHSAWNARHAATGFRQVNDEQNDLLKKWIEQEVPQQSRVLDLYGGSGNLSRGLIPKVTSVDCVDVTAPRELNDEATPFYRYHRSDVLHWLLNQTSEKGSHPSAYRKASKGALTAFIDPPRDGLDRLVSPIAEQLEKLNVKHIIAIGCDPDSWARDLARFSKRGWKLKHGAVFDFFPQTIHVESAGVLAFEK